MSGVFLGNIQSINVIPMAITPVSVAANTTAEQTFTVPGIMAGDYIDVTKPTVTAGISIANSRVSGNNAIAIQFGNATASPIVPPAETYLIEILRPSMPGSNVINT